MSDALYPDPRDVVSSSVIVRVCRGPFCTGSHSKAVVLADEERRQTPELRNVERLEQLALIGRPVAVDHHAEVIVSSVLHRKGNSSAQWNLHEINII